MLFLPNIFLYEIQTPSYKIASRLYTVLVSTHRVAYIVIRHKSVSKGHISAAKATGTVHRVKWTALWGKNHNCQIERVSSHLYNPYTNST